MTRALVEEIIALEHAADDKLVAAGKEAEGVVTKARERAHSIVQQAQAGLDAEREAARKEHADALKQEADAAAADADRQAAAIRKQVEPRIEKAAAYVVDEFLQYRPR